MTEVNSSQIDQKNLVGNNRPTDSQRDGIVDFTKAIIQDDDWNDESLYKHTGDKLDKWRNRSKNDGK